MQLFTRTGHLSEKALQMSCRGELTEDQEVRQHLEQCPYCRRQLSEVTRFLSLVGSVSVELSAAQVEKSG